MSREQLAFTMPEGKMGIDNPSMVKNRKASSVSLQIPEKKDLDSDGKRNSIKRDSLIYGNNQLNGKAEIKEKDYEPYDHRDVKHPTSNNVFVLSTVCDKDIVKSEDYDPYEYREVEHPTTYLETFIHMLKASLGTGILAMPKAFLHAGYLVAIIGTIIIGLICTYTIHILIAAEYELCKRRKVPSMTYPATAQAAVQEGPKSVRWLAPYVPIICNVFLLIYQLGSCCIYVVFVATNIEKVVKAYGFDMDVRLYMLCLLLPLIVINWVRNLKFLAPLSTLANCVTVVSFAIIFYYMFRVEHDIKQIKPVGDLKGIPLFFGTVLFAMEAIGVVMPLENEMKNPRKFGSAFGVLNCAMLPITLLYTFVGFFGYLAYKDETQGAITLNLPEKEILGQCVMIMLAFAIFITHSLACYVAIDITWREYVDPIIESRKLLWEYVLRTILVFITFLFAVLIPNLDLFISLIGAFCLSTMGLSFPALIDLFTHWYDKNGFRFFLFFVKNLIIIIIAILGLVIGTVTSVQEIIVKVF